MQYILLCLATLLLASVVAGAVESDDSAPPRILLLTKSSGFEHSVIKHDRTGTSHVERIMTPLVEQMGGALTATKDASLINADNLENYDVVIFYTSGVLTEKGEDGNPPMTEEGLEAFFDWIRNGGGFIGLHSATDSFRSTGDTPTPYIEMIGGEFVKHGAQFEGAIRNVSPEHPAVASMPESWTLPEEWYLFRHLNKDHMHVLAILEIGEERERQRMYDIPDYPMIWCRAYGAGRVLYNGMGHREDVWEHPTFKAMIEEHIRWAAGEGPLHADPNYEALELE